MGKIIYSPKELERFQKVLAAVKNQTVFDTSSNIIAEMVTALNTLDTLYQQDIYDLDPTFPDMGALAVSISSNSTIIQNNLNYQRENASNNIEIYNSWLDYAYMAGLTDAGDQTYRYYDFFGSVSATKAIRDVVQERISRIQTGEYPIDQPEWVSFLKDEAQEISSWVNGVTTVHESIVFDGAKTDLIAAVEAQSILNMMDTPSGLVLLLQASQGDVYTIAKEKDDENSSRYDMAVDVDDNDPISDDDTPFYDIINDKLP